MNAKYLSVSVCVFFRLKSLGNINICHGTPATIRSSSMRRFIEETETSRRRSKSNVDRNSMTMPSRVRSIKRKTLKLVPSSADRLNVIFVDEDTQDQDVAQQNSGLDSDDEISIGE